MGLFGSGSDDQIDALAEKAHGKYSQTMIEAVDEAGLYLPDVLDNTESLYYITMGADFLEDGQECVDSGGLLGGGLSHYLVITDKRALVILDNDEDPPNRMIHFDDVNDVQSDTKNKCPVLYIESQGTVYEFVAGKKEDKIPECEKYIREHSSLTKDDKDTRESDRGSVNENLKDLIENAEGETVTHEALTDTAIASALDDDEQPHHLLRGNTLLIGMGDEITIKSGMNGSVTTIATNRRVLCSVGGTEIITVPYDSITALEYGQPPWNEMDANTGHLSDFSGKHLIIHTQGRIYYIDPSENLYLPTSTGMENPEVVSEVINFIQSQQTQSMGQSDQTESDSKDPFDQIERLKELREQNAITEEEFQEKKSDILDKI